MRYGTLFDPFTGKECIDDRQKMLFLQSPAYREMLRKMVVGLTGDYKLTVGLLPPSHPELAYTDGKRVSVNTLHELFRNEPLDDIAKYCLALVVHESLHPLYSCFQCIEDAAKKKAGETDSFVQIRRTLFNILEDARIERIGSFKFPGVSYAIEDLNEFIYQHQPLKDDEAPIDCLIGLIMDFVSVNKCRRTPAEEIEKVWKKIIPLAAKAKYADTCNECYTQTKKIMNLLKSYIPPQEEGEAQQTPIKIRVVMPTNNQGNPIDIDAGTGETSPDPKGEEIVIVLQSQNNADEKNDGEPKDDSQSVQSSGMQQDQGGAQAPVPERDSNIPGELKEQIMEILRDALNVSYQDHQQDRNNAESDGSLAAAISCEQRYGFQQVIEFGSYEGMDEYLALKANVCSITNNLKKGLKNILNYNVDEMSRYLHSGRIDGKSLSRMPSGAICAKRIEKNDEADLNITVLVDLSGSMSGHNLKHSKEACTVLFEVCKELSIPLSILGFQDGIGNKTKIRHFTNPRQKSNFACAGIARMTAGGGTPMGEALQYLPDFVRRQKEEDKLVIVITDGSPNGGPDLSKENVKKLSADAKVYGLAIGMGRDVLSQIFGSNFMGIDSLDMLPRELCKIIEKNLFRR